MNTFASVIAVVALAGLTGAGPVLAQSKAVVDLGEKEFTVEDVVNALGARKTRGLKLGDAPATDAAAQEAPTGTAAPATPAPVAAPAEPTERKLSLQLQFALNSAELTPEARKRLDVLGRALGTTELASANLLLSGHTDVTGRYESNLLLSKRRADSVKAYLVAAHDIAAERLKAVGRGPDELLDPDHPKSPANRRVQLAVVD